jgi:hypothetical protein
MKKIFFISLIILFFSAPLFFTTAVVPVNDSSIKLTDKIPCACYMLYDPVCGKDGKTYSNSCFVKCANVEISHKGICGEASCLKEGQIGDLAVDFCCEGLRKEIMQTQSLGSKPKMICTKCNGDSCNALKFCPAIAQISCEDGKVVPRGNDKNGCQIPSVCLKKLSNGKENDVKIMPEVASQNAIEKLGDLGWQVELKGVGQGESAKYVYNADGKKEVKILGLFNVKIKVNAEIDSATGDVIKIKKPWWSFLAW